LYTRGLHGGLPARSRRNMKGPPVWGAGQPFNPLQPSIENARSVLCQPSAILQAMFGHGLSLIGTNPCQ
jgi:hypothetical protein